MRRFRLWLGRALCDGCDRVRRFTHSDGRGIYCSGCWPLVKKLRRWPDA